MRATGIVRRTDSSVIIGVKIRSPKTLVFRWFCPNFREIQIKLCSIWQGGAKKLHNV